MIKIRAQLPHIDGRLFLTDAGLETDLIFNQRVHIPEFASHTLLASSAGRAALTRYYRGFLALAERHRVGFILDSPTWRAQRHWANALGVSIAEMAAINRYAVDFVADLRDEFTAGRSTILLNGVIGPRGDAYAPEALVSADEAEDYHAEQIGWLARTDVDMVSAMTFTQSSEAIGVVRAARIAGLPVVISFTVETDGLLPTGQPLGDAIAEVDAATDGSAAYFMINCAHPEHFRDALDAVEHIGRIRGLRCNASRCSHAELDAAETLDDGDPIELAEGYSELLAAMPWMNVFGGCCGTDLRHVSAIASALIRDGQAARKAAS